MPLPARRRRTSPARAAIEAARPLLYSKTCQLALRAMERIAAVEAKDPMSWVPQAELAGTLEISIASLAQIVFRLRKAGLLSARRGPTGGVGLARPADRITVLEVVKAIDGAGIAGRCILGFDACTDSAPCPAHPVWTKVRPQLESELEQKTLEDLVRTVEAKRRLNARRSTPKA